nr:MULTISPECIES: hypothetical protein [unclassified Empedobacter]
MSWNIFGIQKNGDLKYGVPIYVNQKVIFQHTVKIDDWKGGVMREPNKDWDGRDIYMNFDGVDSFFYL